MIVVNKHHNKIIGTTNELSVLLLLLFCARAITGTCQKSCMTPNYKNLNK